jgi:SAM-dependent methyltransferase
MDSKAHWDRVYRNTAPDQVSWYQAEPELSLRLIRHALPDLSSAIIDVGGGASTLVDALVFAGYQRMTVLDLSPGALEAARDRMGPAAASVGWIEGDVLAAALPAGAFDLWHDRAVFHFLTDSTDRLCYVAQVRHAVKPGGLVLVATFAEDGPTQCSGLEVARYSPERLHTEFGSEFRLLDSVREEHHTPSGKIQPFTYCLCQVRDSGSA